MASIGNKARSGVIRCVAVRPLRPGNLFESSSRPTSARTATPKIFVFALCVMLRAGGLTIGGPLISRSLTIHDAAEPAELG